MQGVRTYALEPSHAHIRFLRSNRAQGARLAEDAAHEPEPGPNKDAWLRSDLYLSAGRSELDPSFFAARFSLRRSLSVFCGFCFCCFFGLSWLLLMSAI